LKISGETMKPYNSSGIFKPFKNLKTLLESKAFELQPGFGSMPGESNAAQSDCRPEYVIFKEAMTDVKKISRANCAVPTPLPKAATQAAVEDPPDETVAQLKKLIKYGTGFDVSLTPEYLEGIANGVNPEVARRLHRGDFSIQSHIDLHGLRVHEAHEAFDEFLNKSILKGKRAVLIIHGRGLSSPAKPILKAKVHLWLTTSPWHKWVIAFTSARACDGGAGATYVLLRQKPLAKRFRKKRTEVQCDRKSTY
jgi:DNA-nicking Smr family endonuclease